jgi:hypothetical protein
MNGTGCLDRRPSGVRHIMNICWAAPEGLYPFIHSRQFRRGFPKHHGKVPLDFPGRGVKPHPMFDNRMLLKSRPSKSEKVLKYWRTRNRPQEDKSIHIPDIEPSHLFGHSGKSAQGMIERHLRQISAKPGFPRPVSTGRIGMGKETCSVLLKITNRKTTGVNGKHHRFYEGVECARWQTLGQPIWERQP